MSWSADALPAAVLAQEQTAVRLHVRLLRLEASRDLARQRIDKLWSLEARSEPSFDRTVYRMTIALAALDGLVAFGRAMREVEGAHTACLARQLEQSPDRPEDPWQDGRDWHEFKQELAELWREAQGSLTWNIQDELNEAVGDEYGNWITQTLFAGDEPDHGPSS